MTWHLASPKESDTEQKARATPCLLLPDVGSHTLVFPEYLNGHLGQSSSLWKEHEYRRKGSLQAVLETVTVSLSHYAIHFSLSLFTISFSY